MYWIVPILLLAAGCKDCPKKTPPFTQIPGRQEAHSEESLAHPVYRVCVPDSWERVDCSNFADTKQANVTYLIEKEIRLTVHSFPSATLENRIPPHFQIERWKQQLKEPSLCEVKPLSRHGFFGYFFEGKDTTQATLAWAMQMDLQHYQTLHFIVATADERAYYEQMAADYTIKATGPVALIEKHKSSLLAFAESFELIQDIPERL